MASKSFFLFAILVIMTVSVAGEDKTTTKKTTTTSQQTSAPEYDEYNKRCEKNDGERFVNAVGDDCQCRNPFGFKNTTNTRCWRPKPTTTSTLRTTTTTTTTTSTTTLATTTRDRSGEVYYERHSDCNAFASGRANRTFVNAQGDQCKCMKNPEWFGKNTECTRVKTTTQGTTTQTPTTQSPDAPTSSTQETEAPASSSHETDAPASSSQETEAPASSSQETEAPTSSIAPEESTTTDLPADFFEA